MWSSVVELDKHSVWASSSLGSSSGQLGQVMEFWVGAGKSWFLENIWDLVVLGSFCWATWYLNSELVLGISFACLNAWMYFELEYLFKKNWVHIFCLSPPKSVLVHLRKLWTSKYRRQNILLYSLFVIKLIKLVSFKKIDLFFKNKLCICKCPWKSRCQILWSWNYRQLWVVWSGCWEPS